MKYRKKPVIVEAFKFGVESTPAWFMRAMDKGKIRVFLIPHEDRMEINYVGIQTLEGEMRGEKDDFFIQGVEGEIYPCKPEIFAKTYELVEE